DVSAIKSVTLTAVKLESTDGGDLSFVSGATLSISGNGLPDALLATLPSPPASGQTSVQLQINARELKPYVLMGGAVAASITSSPDLGAKASPMPAPTRHPNAKMPMVPSAETHGLERSSSPMASRTSSLSMSCRYLRALSPCLRMSLTIIDRLRMRNCVAAIW